MTGQEILFADVDAELKSTSRTSLPFYDKQLVSVRRDQSIATAIQNSLQHLDANDNFISAASSAKQIEYGKTGYEKCISELSSMKYSDCASTIDSEYRTIVVKHLSEYHNSNSTYENLGNYCTTSLDNLLVSKLADDKQFLQDVEFNDDNNSYIQVSCASMISSNSSIISGKYETLHIDDYYFPFTEYPLPSLDHIQYTFKRYTNGFKDLTFYIPTTFTYATSSNHENCTIVNIELDNQHFGFTEIAQCMVNAQSLPLCVGNDSLSCICKHSTSILLNSDNRNQLLATRSIQLKFLCCNSDAQAIKIIGK